MTAVLTKEILAFETGQNAIDASENQMDAYFTAPEAGVYTLNATLEAGDHIVVNISESDRWLYTNQKISYVLAADESLYFTAPQGTKGSITIGKEASMRDLTQDTNTGLSKGINWFRFSAEEYGYYGFAFDKAVKAAKIYKNADVSDKTNLMENCRSFGVDMEDGETLYLYVETENTASVRVEKEDEMEEIDLSYLWDYEWELNQGRP